MAGARNHYEQSFSGLLLEHGLNALAVDESRRPLWGERELKNFDFLVNGAERVYAIDLKGRRETPWITRLDMFSMMAWQRLLGQAAHPAFVFAFFHAHGSDAGRIARLDATERVTPAGVYRFVLLELADAQRLARPRSERWGTLGFGWNGFARAAVPLELALGLGSLAG